MEHSRGLREAMLVVHGHVASPRQVETRTPGILRRKMSSFLSPQQVRLSQLQISLLSHTKTVHQFLSVAGEKLQNLEKLI